MMAGARLDGNADAVEFCPTPPFHHVLAAATYTLHEGPPPSRSGTLTLFSLREDGSAGPAALRLQQTHRSESSGIFDIKWKPYRTPAAPVLAQATADGSLCVYEMKDNTHLKELSRENISTAMCLALDWDPHSSEQLVVSHSDGQVTVVDLGESLVEVQESNRAHGFEAWCVAYDAWRSNVIYSGGDDCHFCCWDLRQGFFQPAFKERITHQMGVCSIQSNPHQENILATGSYDENLRVWDVRMLKSPLMGTTKGLGGGVWKLKWNPFYGGLIAAACMHNGFNLVNVQEDELRVTFQYKKHESLAYGVDWCRALPKSISQMACATDNHSVSRDIAGVQERFLLATCSFYDQSLHVWEHIVGK